jgi:hypothetical protein
MCWKGLWRGGEGEGCEGEGVLEGAVGGGGGAKGKGWKGKGVLEGDVSQAERGSTRATDERDF